MLVHRPGPYIWNVPLTITDVTRLTSASRSGSPVWFSSPCPHRACLRARCWVAFAFSSSHVKPLAKSLGLPFLFFRAKVGLGVMRHAHYLTQIPCSNYLVLLLWVSTMCATKRVVTMALCPTEVACADDVEHGHGKCSHLVASTHVDHRCSAGRCEKFTGSGGPGLCVSTSWVVLPCPLLALSSVKSLLP